MSTTDKITKKLKKKMKAQPIPKNAQSSIPYSECYENGVIRDVYDWFSKTYQYNDTTFKTLPDDEQRAVYKKYGEFLNTLIPGDSLSLHFINQAEDISSKIAQITPPPKNDHMDYLREEMTEVITSKMLYSRNNIATQKYMTYRIESDSVDEAMKRFLDIDEMINKGFKRITHEDVHPLTLPERLELMRHVINGDSECHYFEHDKDGNTNINWKLLRRHGLTTKDIIAAPLKFNVSNFIIGERFGQTLFLNNVANWLNTDFINELTECAFESSINLHITPLAQDEATRLIKNQSISITAEVIEAQKKALEKGYSPEFIAIDLKNAKEQVDELQEDLKNRDQKLFMFSMTIMHTADNMEALKKQHDQLKAVANKYMCSMQPLTLQQERGFGACLPLGVNRTLTKRPLTTESLSIFIPFNEVSCFEPGGYYYGINPINKTVICRNRLLGRNYNGLILGMPGTGKSFSAKREIFNTLLMTDAQIYVVDPDGEYSPSADAAHGAVIKVAPGSGVYLNPLDLDIDTSHDSDGDPIAMKTDFVCGLIETMAHGRLTPIQKAIINRCVIQIYRPYIEHLNSLPADPLTGKRRTIDRDACPTLQNLFDIMMSQSEPEAQNLALVMEPFTAGSFDVFAHRTNVDVENRFIVYNIRDIGSNLRDLGLKICLNDIWNKMIENRSKQKWTWAYIDEFHLLLSSESSAEFLKSIWKRARKYWGVPTGITQNTEELLSSPAARAIINNSDFILMLSQSAIDRQNLAEILKLSPTDLEYITNVECGCGLLYNGKRAIPFKDEFPTNTELYKLMSTKAGENI